MHRLPTAIDFLYIVAHPYVSQVPEYCRRATGAIEVPIDDRTSSFAGTRSEAVPSHVVPGMARGCGPVAIGSNAHRLNERIDAYVWNNQAFWNDQDRRYWTRRADSCLYCRNTLCCRLSWACLLRSRLCAGNSRAATRA